jgi:hypothetical protein
MQQPPPAARMAPSTARNRQPILEVLAPRLGIGAKVLEIASGAGEHAVFIGEALPGIQWVPSDPDPDARASIAAWIDHTGLGNVILPLDITAETPERWPDGPFSAVVCINMLHISPWSAAEGLMAGAAKVLTEAGRLFLYGPYLEAGVETAPSNLAFDRSLRSRNPAWGIRDLADVTALAASHGLALAERIEMPANNLVVAFRRV